MVRRAGAVAVYRIYLAWWAVFTCRHGRAYVHFSVDPFLRATHTAATCGAPVPLPTPPPSSCALTHTPKTHPEPFTSHPSINGGGLCPAI